MLTNWEQCNRNSTHTHECASHALVQATPGVATYRGGGAPNLKADKCKPEVMHSTVKHKCILFSMPNLVKPQDTHCV